MIVDRLFSLNTSPNLGVVLNGVWKLFEFA